MDCATQLHQTETVCSPLWFRGALLTTSQIAQFHRTGFLSLNDLTTKEDLAYIGDTLDELVAHFHALPPSRTNDLAGPKVPGRPPVVPEILLPTALHPRLKRTVAFSRCEAIAGQLLGHTARHCFDHAIYKRAWSNRETPWHQDEAYQAIGPRPVLTFWLALDEATTQNGCMHYLPGSHQHGILPHRRKGNGPHAPLGVDGIDISGAVACPLPAGGVTVHCSRTLHWTGPNVTHSPRRAWIILFDGYGRGVYRVSLLKLSHVVAKYRRWRRV
jgi:ectoine hydroxylase-related dioxygenase (phytanoyl-CoA dioxygenase family)